MQLTLDFETYYDPASGYTLSKMSTEAYIRDPRFRVLGVGLQVGNRPPRYVHAADVARVLASVPWRQVEVIAHNAAFDGAILTWCYGHKPGAWRDTLSMARGVLPAHLPKSLAALSIHFGLGVKGVLPPEADQKAMATYCMQDVRLTTALYGCLRPEVPEQELDIIDSTIRLFTEPVLMLDEPALTAHADAIRARKALAIEALGVTREDVQSAARFKYLLEAAGGIVPMKEGKNGPIPALAKTDEAFKALLEHESERVQALVELRLGTKGTTEETRCEALAAIGRRGCLPVFLNYCGAHTHRFSGGDKINLQNLKKGSPARTAIEAPAGYVLVVVDSAQIEARMLAWLADEQTLLEGFRRSEDVYSVFASRLYGRPINKTDDPKERFLGKTAVLGLGFGMGKDRFRATCADKGVRVSPEESQTAVTLYRQTYSAIPRLWRDLDGLIPRIRATEHAQRDRDGLFKMLKVADQALWMPSGLPIHYPDLRYEGDQWTYQGRAGRTKLHGPKLCENIVQSLTRDVLVEHWQAIEPDYHIVMTTHDELVACVLEDRADDALQMMLGVMRTAPSWCRELPLDAEGGYAYNYSK